jgi:hypothetical protein
MAVIRQYIDTTGLARIGTAGKSHLRPFIRRALGKASRAGHKAGAAAVYNAAVFLGERLLAVPVSLKHFPDVVNV